MKRRLTLTRLQIADMIEYIVYTSDSSVLMAKRLGHLARDIRGEPRRETAASAERGV